MAQSGYCLQKIYGRSEITMTDKRIFTAPSSDGIHTLCGVVYLPEGKPKGLFHVVHGMTEHMDRYDRFLSDMADSGYIAFGYNHLGHKGSVDDSELGYIADKNGWELLARDVEAFSYAVREEFGSPDMPYYLMGHSMGSFVVRVASEKFVKPTKLIVMGTGGPNPVASAGLALIGIIKFFRGKKHISSLIENVAFGSYNKKFGGDDPNDPKKWLTNDESVRKTYYADKYCMFKFTVSAMGDLIKSIKCCNSNGWFKNIDKNLPILLVSGADDPVGDYGKGILKVEENLKRNGKNVTCKLYEGARHEILNDFTYDTVKEDILSFIK